jgi:exodeoxyribonuclease VII large subunit
VSAKPVPISYGDRRVFSVSGFNRGIAWYLKRLPAVWVEGEIAELRRNDRWGFVFITLKDTDGRATLSATMTRQRFDALEPAPQVGERVHALGRSEIWERRGELRLTIIKLERFGIGMLLQQIEVLKARLAAEGLFDPNRKRPLPFLPRTIGLVCGSDAAAKRDVVETAEVRYPPARFRVLEVPVQGAGAPARIAGALRLLDADPQVDVIVVARGGGSVEDLLAFSDELVCRAVAACTTPVVSAIGHEQDSPLIDLVADARAGTPSLAARLIVPDHAQEAARLDALLARAGRALEGNTARSRRLLGLLVSRPAFRSPETWISVRRERLGSVAGALRRAAPDRLQHEAQRLRHDHERLRLLGPAATLERGYAIVQDTAGAVLRDAGAASPDDQIGVRLGRGGLRATVTEVHE